MATVKEHYDNVLSDVYSWMFGGFESAVQRTTDFINKHNLEPKSSALAVDLGSGCGFQSIPLAKSSYNVTAIDIDSKLLNELEKNCGKFQIKTVNDDLVNFDKYSSKDLELIICMTDTVLHLESKEKVSLLFNKVYDYLEQDGKFVLTFRDLTYELKELDRFIPVKNDNSTIFTCFLEYEQETVKVHDIIYKNTVHGWKLFKSFYRKLRLSKAWIENELVASGFKDIDLSAENGLVTIIAKK